jgi:hypothetical protein
MNIDKYTNKRDTLIISIYFGLIMLELISSSFMIHNKNNIINYIEYNNTFIEKCNNSNIYKNYDNIFNNILAMLINISIIFTTFIFLIINKFKNKRKRIYDIKYQNDLESDGLILNNKGIIKKELIDDETIDITINILFVLSIISHIIINIIQFIYQINNIDIYCIQLINNHVNNFYIIYNLLSCISFISVILFFIIGLILCL